MALPFAGRGAELARLDRLWFDVRDGRAPRVAVVLADAGLGKTRLIHEFYRRSFAPAARGGGERGYWPDDLGEGGDNLLVQPPLPSVQVDAPLRHLWWGIRLPDPVGVNALATGVLPGSVVRDLLPHVDAVTREQRRKKRTRRALATAADLAVDLAVDTVPFGGLVKSLLGAGVQWREQLAEARADGAAAARAAQREQDLHAKLLADFRALLGGRPTERVPTVSFVDDGQFSHHDPSLVAFVSAALLRGVLARADTPEVRSVLAHERFSASLRSERAGDGAAAAAAAAEAIALLRPLVGVGPGARRQLIGALAQATDVAVAAHDAAAARDLAAEALAVARAAAGEGAGRRTRSAPVGDPRRASVGAPRRGSARARADRRSARDRGEHPRRTPLALRGDAPRDRRVRGAPSCA